MKLVRDLFYKGTAAISDWLVYHRFLRQPLSFFEDNLSKGILLEVKAIEEILVAFTSEHSGWFTDRHFNQYGAFMCRDLINKELFNINEYAVTELFDAVSRSSIKSNFSVEVQKIIAELSKKFAEDPRYQNTGSESYMNLFFKTLPLLLLKFFAPKDLVNFSNNFLYSIAALLAFERKGYAEFTSEEAIKTKAFLEDFLFEVVNDSLHIYSYNFYMVVRRMFPDRMSNRMATVQFKFKTIQNDTYCYMPKRMAHDVPLFRRK